MSRIQIVVGCTIAVVALVFGIFVGTSVMQDRYDQLVTERVTNVAVTNVADELLVLKQQQLAYVEQLTNSSGYLTAAQIGRVHTGLSSGVVYGFHNSTLHWLKQEFPNCQIVSVGYGSHQMRKAGGAEMVYFIISPLCPDDQSGSWVGGKS